MMLISAWVLLILEATYVKCDLWNEINKMGASYSYPGKFRMKKLKNVQDYQNARFEQNALRRGFQFADIIGFISVQSIENCLQACTAYEPCMAFNYVEDYSRSGKICVFLRSATKNPLSRLWMKPNMPNAVVHGFFTSGPKSNVRDPKPAKDKAGKKGVPKSCGVPFNFRGNRGRIVGGYEAKPFSRPWTVKLQFFNPQTQQGHDCGGTLIPRLGRGVGKSSDLVVTAAHCVKSARDRQLPSHTTARLGSHREDIIEKHEVELKAKRIISHRLYRPAQEIDYPDIALIQLAKPVYFNRFIRPACMPKPEVPTNPQSCIANGWGLTVEKGQPSIPMLEVRLPILSEEVCTQFWPRGYDVQSDLCAGFTRPGKGTCQGDSGGPLVCLENKKFTLFGATSRGRECASVPAVYARIAKLKEWLSKAVNSFKSMGEDQHKEL